MAYKISSLLLALVFFVSILLAIAKQAIASRDIPNNPKDDDQMKQSKFLLHKHDHSALIPGLGRVYLPPIVKHHKPYTGHTGGIGGIGGIGGTGGGIGGVGGTGGTGGNSYVPGGDDTFVPNPGFEVPNPGNGVSGTPGTPTIP